MIAWKSKFAFAAVPHVITDDARLTPTDRNVVLVLLKQAKRHSEAWITNEAIAKAIRLSVRTVQACLARLEACGHILRKERPDLAIGRAIVLLWRAPLDRLFSDSQNCTQGRNESHGGGAIDCAPKALPPAPPLIGCDREVRKEDGCAPKPPTPLPGPDSLQSESTQQASPEEIKAAVSKAAAVIGDSPSTRDRVLGLAKRWGLGWVAAAFDRAAEKQKKEPLTNPLGYVCRVLEGFAREGGPAQKPTREELDAQREKKYADRLASLLEYQREQEEAFEKYRYQPVV